MSKTAEAVSIGHPDKIADYISSYILDRMIEFEPHVKYAVEVMIKDNTVILGGEITGKVNLNKLHEYVIDALTQIGYTREYYTRWGDNTINPDKINVINMIGAQSPQIAIGVKNNGWGDQGVFVGYACDAPGNIGYAHYLAKKLNRALYDYAHNSDNLGLDIKTQITLDDKNNIETAIVAIPMLKDTDLSEFIINTLGTHPQNIIVNGTGKYTTHASIADCGITGRKLACDFYSTYAPIGGGAPWTKDGSKADLTLNLYARLLALQHLGNCDECTVYLSSCIGRADMPGAEIKNTKNGVTTTQKLISNIAPDNLIKLFNLDTPVYAKLCMNGITDIKI